MEEEKLKNVENISCATACKNGVLTGLIVMPPARWKPDSAVLGQFYPLIHSPHDQKAPPLSVLELSPDYMLVREALR